MFISHLTIKAKLALAFAVMTALVLVLSTLAIRSLISERDAFTHYVNEKAARTTMANDILDAANVRTVHARNLVLASTPGDVAEKVAAGDLRSTVAVTGKDETAKLPHALKGMNDSLSGIVGRVRNGSDSIATGSSQIAAGTADLSARTVQQAASLQETTASMEQLNKTVKANAETARKAIELAGSASSAAVEGGEVVATMDDITDSSWKIADIIGVIDGIAFQTNILVLDAAVEAARAGEQGSGVAVVASEVRSLAQRSADAAKEIKELIGASVEKVENGTRLVDAARASMEDIVAQVQNVTTMISEIGSATLEQTAGIGAVSTAADRLGQQAQSLAEVVGVFKLANA